MSKYIEIKHNKLKSNQKLFYDGNDLFRLLNSGKMKKINKRIRNNADAYDVFGLTLKDSKLKYIYYYNNDIIYTECDYTLYNSNLFGFVPINNDLLCSITSMKNKYKNQPNINAILKSLNDEEWRPLNDIYYIHESGKIINIDGYELLPSTCFFEDCEYLVTNIYFYENNERYIHRLVARAFHPHDYKPGLVVNHIDGNKHNNHYTNLEWCTSQENTQHAVDTGLLTYENICGENNYTAKLSNSDIENICKLILERYDNRYIAKIYDIDETVISRIRRKETWDHLNCVKELPNFSKRLKKFTVEEEKLMIKLISEGYTSQEVYNQLPDILKKNITLSPIKETKTLYNKGLLNNIDSDMK